MKDFLFLPLFISLFSTISALEPSDAKLRTLYNSLDPTSLKQHLAFYELYENHPLGQQALQETEKLLLRSSLPVHSLALSLSPTFLKSLVQLTNRPANQELPSVAEEDFPLFDRIAASLPHTQLAGHWIEREEDLIKIDPDQIDLARALFLSQCGSDLKKVKTYEAFIDLMAIQIAASLPAQATAEKKIEVINRFIFEEMNFRFPPHSLYAKDIDLYTFLPSVLDSRRGVCLGVSILYLCIAQRLSLPLEMVTPPGHIYVRYRQGEQLINIETTARGIHMDSEDYLGINTRSLQERTLKEVVGLAHFNQASVFWQKEDYPQALAAYQKAALYMGQDPLLMELTGYIYAILGDKQQAREHLEAIKGYCPPYALFKDSVAEDYLLNHVDAEGIKAIYQHVDEKRSSILEKRDRLLSLLDKYPKFRSGWFHLAVTWLQLYRTGEALEALERYRELEEEDPTAHYYLAVLYGQRQDYRKAWKHLQQAEALVTKQHYKPKVLEELRRELLLCCPE